MALINRVGPSTLQQDDRNHVWGKRRELKGIRLYLNEDFSRETKGKRATLHKVVKEANKQGMRSSLLGDSLIIVGRRYTVDSLHTLPPEINPVAISTRNIGENAIAFFTHLSQTSIRDPSKLTEKGEILFT